MADTTESKAISLEDLRISIQEVFNKGFGNSGTCSTAEDTAVKTVTLGTIFSLDNGCMMLVKFTNGITSENSTLAVTHTTWAGTTVTEDAKPIYLNGAALEADVIQEGAILILRYNGTQFDVVGGAGIAYTRKEVDQKIADTVHLSEQILTEEQKAQARENIGVVGSGFQVTTDETTGTDMFAALGTSTITHNDTTGADVFTF